ncbi:hypothetical protein K7G19_13030 [Cupriavidus sp. DB3]|uniref:glycosyltransferase n=1 Tax=Cupriavidus sp. DB3 TaxID=2873259 RepID=UPI001CF441B1|nr:glycosyltransferase [Cupriavidus sp. DB3]MCA7084529.1 hypothetical protein [Cupriavidus sp. DB3]
MRVIYYATSPRPDAHAGGVKVIYDHCNALNDMGIPAAILHERRGHLYRWARRPAPTIAAKDLRATDHLVLPEIKAASLARMLVKAGMPYSIFVQNGYYLSERCRHTSDSDICFAYQNASAILSISSDTSDLLALHYPSLADRIVNVQCSIHADTFATGRGKRNVITFMPRKNGRHAAAVLFALKQRLPAGWDTIAIDGMNETQVAEALQMSRIFMSFSDLEGLGLPPIEAALCGNYVIGYHGGGGREYWRAPNFEPVDTGDIGSFARRVLARVDQLEKTPADSIGELLPGIDVLRARYSPANEQAGLRRFVSAIGATSAPTQQGSTAQLDSLSKLQRRAKLRWWLGATVAG